MWDLLDGDNNVETLNVQIGKDRDDNPLLPSHHHRHQNHHYHHLLANSSCGIFSMVRPIRARVHCSTLGSFTVVIDRIVMKMSSRTMSYIKILRSSGRKEKPVTEGLNVVATLEYQCKPDIN